MSLLSVIKNIFTDAGKLAAVFAGGETLLNSLFPATMQPSVIKVENGFSAGFAVVADVEGIIASVSDPSAKTGPEKIKAAAPKIGKLIADVEVLPGMTFGKHIKDQSLFQQQSEQMAGLLADMLNNVDIHS